MQSVEIDAEMLVDEFLAGFADWAPDGATVSVYELEEKLVLTVSLYEPDGWERETDFSLFPHNGLHEAHVMGIRLGAALTNSVVLHRAGDMDAKLGIEQGLIPLPKWMPEDL